MKKKHITFVIILSEHYPHVNIAHHHPLNEGKTVVHGGYPKPEPILQLMLKCSILESGCKKF